MGIRKILQLQVPQPGAPLCSGMEFVLTRGQQLVLRHFHTLVTVKNVRASSWFSDVNAKALDCSMTIDMNPFESQQFVLSQDDLGKTLFCAGFPCLTITGLSEDLDTVTVTISEIVQPWCNGAPCVID